MSAEAISFAARNGPLAPVYTLTVFPFLPPLSQTWSSFHVEYFSSCLSCSSYTNTCVRNTPRTAVTCRRSRRVGRSWFYLPSYKASIYIPICLHASLIDCRPAELRLSLQKDKQVIYSGIDPTGVSLHVGHLVPMMCLLHFQLRGHQIIPLVSFLNRD